MHKEKTLKINISPHLIIINLRISYLTNKKEKVIHNTCNEGRNNTKKIS